MSKTTVKEHVVREHERVVPKPHKKGRKFTPTEDEHKAVQTMAGYGMPAYQICHLIRVDQGGITDKTFTKYFKDDFVRGKSAGNLKIAQSLYLDAIGGNLIAKIFYLKCQAGWQEKQRVELSGPDGGPIQNAHGVMVVERSMSDDEWEKYAATLKKGASDLTPAALPKRSPTLIEGESSALP